MKVAIIHEYIVKMGGAEKVLEEVSGIFPEADIFCLVQDENFKALKLDYSKIRSLTAKFPNFLTRRYQNLVFLYPHLIDNLDLSQYDLVISLSNSFSHGVLTNQETCQISYYHSPTRFIWDYFQQYQIDLELKGLKKLIWKVVAHKLRIWDFVASKRADFRICISQNIQNRLQKYYKLDAKIIYPPVNLEGLEYKQDEGYYLIISRLSKYKNVDLAIRAFNQNGKKLIIAGTGSDEKNLKNLANQNIEFLGYVSDEKRLELFQKCKGFICLARSEDFGITPVEAMACGKPVFALNDGGIKETVQDQIHGILFKELTLESFEEGFQEFEKFIQSKWNKDTNLKQATKFSSNRFREEFLEFVKECYREKTNQELKF